jgi:hypothetical protein
MGGVTRRSVVCSRILVALAFILLVVMPITEHLWTFDKFLRGGPDLELGLFALVSVLCLVSVLASHRRQDVALLLAVHRLLYRYRQAYAAPWLLGYTRAPRTAPASDSLPPSLSLINLPLQV